MFGHLGKEEFEVRLEVLLEEALVRRRQPIAQLLFHEVALLTLFVRGAEESLRRDKQNPSGMHIYSRYAGAGRGGTFLSAGGVSKITGRIGMPSRTAA